MTTPHYELFEGNEGFNIGGDARWGNAVYITFFRNHATGVRRSLDGLGLTDVGNRYAAGTQAGHWWYNFVGNVLGYSGMKPGPGGSSFVYEGQSYQNPVPMWKLGNGDSVGHPDYDPQVAATALRDGNYDYYTNEVRWHGIGGNVGDGTPQTIPASLYLTSKPAFFGSLPWPWVDPTGTTKLYTLPARARFDGPAAASLSINDVTQDEGNSGTQNATFTVTLSPAASQTVTVSYATANGTATAGSDYTAASGTLTFAAGETSKTIAVAVTGDTTIEADETFTVTLSGASGAPISRAQGTGTIRNDDFPALSINDVTVNEGNSGTTNAVFTVSLSATSPQTITVNYATANGTATAGSDYAATSRQPHLHRRPDQQDDHRRSSPATPRWRRTRRSS